MKIFFLILPLINIFSRGIFCLSVFKLAPERETNHFTDSDRQQRQFATSFDSDPEPLLHSRVNWSFPCVVTFNLTDFTAAKGISLVVATATGPDWSAGSHVIDRSPSSPPLLPPSHNPPVCSFLLPALLSSVAVVWHRVQQEVGVVALRLWKTISDNPVGLPSIWFPPSPSSPQSHRRHLEGRAWWLKKEKKKTLSCSHSIVELSNTITLPLDYPVWSTWPSRLQLHDDVLMTVARAGPQWVTWETVFLFLGSVRLVWQ